MSKYIIIDSGPFVNVLKMYLEPADAKYIAIGVHGVSDIVDIVETECKKDNRAIIFINADEQIAGTGENILDIILWMRCKYKYLNPIVIYSIYYLERLLQSNPKNYFIVSPGCIFKEDVDVVSSIEAIKRLKPIPSIEGLKPFLKQRVDDVLCKCRHRMANYAGMALMLNVALQVYFEAEKNMQDSKIMRGNFPEYVVHRKSLDYALLSTYYELDKLTISDAQKQELKRRRKTKILLVDDMADKGWQPIISQMLYGKSTAISELKSVKIVKNIKENKLDLEATKIELIDDIKNHKPNLILLDLRLNDEKGQIPLKQLDGYKLLEFLKKSTIYKGVPVIMFTSSSNAETVKALLIAGAESVWTKPGIDEGLSVGGIIQRYKQFLELVDKSINKDYSLLKNADDSNCLKDKIDDIKKEEIRSLLFKKIDYINYRLRLYDDNQKMHLLPELYRSCDAIYIDTNILVSGEADYRYADLVSSLIILANLTSKARCNCLEGSINDNIILPKVVVMNPVYDEIIKIAKVASFDKGKYQKSLIYLRASLSIVILKSLFESEKIRTELYADYETHKAISKLQNPKESIYADPYIIDEIATVVMTKKSHTVTYKENAKVVLISGDYGLKEKIKRFKDSDKKDLEVVSRERFIRDINSINI